MSKIQPLESFFDTHTHLDFPEFDQDRTKILQRAHAAKVNYFLNPGCDLLSSQRANNLAQKNPNILAAVGIHPHSAHTVNATALKKLQILVQQNSKIVALGEIGLDLYKNYNSLAIQTQALRQQLNLAQKLNLPVILHSRSADQEITQVLAEFPNLRGVCHCFSSGPDLAHQMLAKGLYLGFTGICTFPKSAAIRAIIQATPLTKILLETDAPFLAPQPQRGQRNESSFLPAIAAKIAELKNVSLTEVQTITTQNALALFNLKKSV